MPCEIPHFIAGARRFDHGGGTAPVSTPATGAPHLLKGEIAENVSNRVGSHSVA